MEAPSLTHWLGADPLGRNILSCLVFGARMELIVGFSAAFMGGTVGQAACSAMRCGMPSIPSCGIGSEKSSP